MRHPELYRYNFDVAQVAEVWRRGSVVASWLLDLAAVALRKCPDLDTFAGRVSDSGEGRWTLQAAIDESVPAPVISAALFARSARAAKPTMPIACSRHCVLASAAISKSQRAINDSLSATCRNKHYGLGRMPRNCVLLASEEPAACEGIKLLT